jgi:hypothetical protein
LCQCCAVAVCTPPQPASAGRECTNESTQTRRTVAKASDPRACSEEQMRGHDSGLRPSRRRLVAQSARAVRRLRCRYASAGDTVLCALDQPRDARRSSYMVGRYGASFSEAFVLEGRPVRDGCAARAVGGFGRGAGYRASARVGRRRVQHHRETGEPGPDVPNVAERQRRRELCDRLECRARLLSMPRARWGRQGLLPQQRGRVPMLGEADRYLDPVRFQGDLYERPPARVPHVRSGHLTGELSAVPTAVGDQSGLALLLSPVAVAQSRPRTPGPRSL